MPIEGRGKRRRVVVEPRREDGVRREPGRDERLVDSVARERIDETGSVTDEQDPAASGWCAQAPHRKAVSPNGIELVRLEAVRAREPVEMGAELRPFLH